MLNIYKNTNAQCGTVNFFKSGHQPHVPLISLPITINSSNEVLTVTGRFVLSCRPDASQSYAGFPHPYFAAGGLILVDHNPTQLDDMPLGAFLDEPSGHDGWLGAGTDASPMHPYTNHLRLATYVTAETDIGPRWISMLAWTSSSYAGAWDYLLNEQMQGSLTVRQESGGTRR